MTSRGVFLLPLLFLACQAPPDSQVPVTREAINSQLPERPYSQAMRVGNTFYFSGKLGVTEETLAMTEGRIEAETRNVMESFKELFQEVGPPYAARWPLEPGTHRIEARVPYTDLRAGPVTVRVLD